MCELWVWIEEARVLAQRTAEVQQSLPPEQQDFLYWHFWTDGPNTLCALMIGTHWCCPELSLSTKEVTLRTGAAHAALSDSKEMQTVTRALRAFRAGEKLPAKLLGVPVGF